MLKFFEWVMVLLCTTAVSCRRVGGFPLLKSRAFSLSGSVVQHYHIHGLKHADLNWTVSSEKVDDKDEYHKFFQSKKSKGGKGATGGANVPHHPSRKNAAPSTLNPPCFLLTVSLYVIATLILSFPALILHTF